MMKMPVPPSIKMLEEKHPVTESAPIDSKTGLDKTTVSALSSILGAAQGVSETSEKGIGGLPKSKHLDETTVKGVSTILSAMAQHSEEPKIVKVKKPLNEDNHFLTLVFEGKSYLFSSEEFNNMQKVFKRVCAKLVKINEKH